MMTMLNAKLSSTDFTKQNLDNIDIDNIKCKLESINILSNTKFVLLLYCTYLDTQIGPSNVLALPFCIAGITKTQPF